MQIRSYQAGDEQAQAEIYNGAAARLPAFKPATAEEIGRRYRTADADPTTRLYALRDGQVVGYITFQRHGRLSQPWCRPGCESAAPALLDAALEAMARRGIREAWAAYRSDWTPVLDLLGRHGFAHARDMINYVAEVASLPRVPVPDGRAIGPLDRPDLPRVLDLGGDLFRDEGPADLEGFVWGNPFIDPASAFALRARDGGELLGAALAVIGGGYADPAGIDPAMPCFRLGALGAERERHKRVNGLFSCVFGTEAAAEILLAEAARRIEAAGLAHAAAQAPSDQPRLVAFHDRYFQRQATFPILVRKFTVDG